MLGIVWGVLMDLAIFALRFLKHYSVLSYTLHAVFGTVTFVFTIAFNVIILMETGTI